MKIFTPYPFDCAEITSVPDREGASAIVYRKHMLVVCGGLNGNNGNNGTAGVEEEKNLAPKCSIIRLAHCLTCHNRQSASYITFRFQQSF